MPLSPLQNHPAIERIAQIPSREYTTDQVAKITEIVTNRMRKPGGGMALWPHQALALFELHKYRVCFGGKLQVGSGKTLIAALAPAVLGAVRPILLVPADMEEASTAAIQEFQRHFIFPIPRIMSYQYFSRDFGGKDFESYRPDCVVGDEAHFHKNLKAGGPKKLYQYFQQNPKTYYIPLTGSAFGGKIEHFAHLAHLSLRKLCPVPCVVDGKNWQMDLTAWGEVLNPGSGEHRPAGAIYDIAQAQGWEIPGDVLAQGDQAAARWIVAKRFRHTPGVVENFDLNVGASIQIHFHAYNAPKKMQEAWKLCRNWTRPDGFDLVDAMEVWRLANQLACGFFYRWTEEAPADWMSARKAWGARVRRTLDASPTIYTPWQVEQIAKQQRWDEWGEWADIRGTFEPETEPVYISDHVQHIVDKFLKKGGVAFVPHKAVQSFLKGYKIFGEKGLSDGGELIDNCKDFAVIASDISCVRGHNLQKTWNRALVLQPRASAEWTEQMIGRFHRPGQKEDTVEIHCLVGCVEHKKALYKLFPNVKYSNQISNQQQKYLIADKIRLRETLAHTGPGYEWKEKNSK